MKDGEFMLWNIESMNSDVLPVKIKFSKHVTMFDVFSEFVVAGGNSLPMIVIKSLKNARDEKWYSLPVGCRGIMQFELLRDKSLLGFLSEGYFYLADIQDNLPGDKYKVTLNIRIPHESIISFQVDATMSTVVLGTSNGNVFLYDLPKALEN